jgi:hypothetical protein
LEKIKKEEGMMTEKRSVLRVCLLFVLILCCGNSWGWCSSGDAVGSYQVALTPSRLSDNHCVKSGLSGKIYSFVPSGIGSSTSCPVFPVVYCGDTFVGELHFPGKAVTCSVGEPIRIAYDSNGGCKDLANHVEGAINVNVATTGEDFSWVGWVVGVSVGVAVITTFAIALITGGSCLYKYNKDKGSSGTTGFHPDLKSPLV